MSTTMTKTDGNSQALADGVASAPEPTPPTPQVDSQGRRMRINWLDRMAVKGTATGSEEDFGQLYGLVEETMNALWLEPDAARLRLLARTIAVLRAKIELLEGLSDRALMAGDLPFAAAIQKYLDGTTRRMTMLLTEHRLATQAERRSVSVAVVGHTTQVNVQAAR